LHTAERYTNFSEEFLADVKKQLKLEWTDDKGGDLRKTVGPEDVLAYAYAVFHAPSFRDRYAEFLKRDFPRLPLTSDVKLFFAALAGKGRELIEVHLMRSPKLDNFITEFPVKGDNVVEKAAYTPANQRVWVNAQQYFGSVPQTLWEALIGGYQVCEQWLMDRKGRKLSYDDVQHWQRIVVAIKETSRLNAQIDDLIPGWPLP
jgi:predicted helicase